MVKGLMLSGSAIKFAKHLTMFSLTYTFKELVRWPGSFVKLTAIVLGVTMV